MNLYLIWQDVNIGYGTFDSAVVCASSTEEAKKIHPYGSDGAWETDQKYFGVWAKSPDDVQAELIGLADDDVEAGVVLVLFHAG